MTSIWFLTQSVDPSREQGFSTLEALVSFFILSSVLVGTIELLSTSFEMLKREREMNSTMQALMEIRTGIVPELIAVSGDSETRQEHDGWVISVRPIREPKSAQPAMIVHHIRIEKAGGNGPHSFNTFRLVERELAQ